MSTLSLATHSKRAPPPTRQHGDGIRPTFFGGNRHRHQPQQERLSLLAAAAGPVPGVATNTAPSTAAGAADYRQYSPQWSKVSRIPQSVYFTCSRDEVLGDDDAPNSPSHRMAPRTALFYAPASTSTLIAAPRQARGSTRSPCTHDGVAELYAARRRLPGFPRAVEYRHIS